VVGERRTTVSAGRGAGTTDGTRALEPALLLVGILVTSWVALLPATGEVPLAPIWPASGLAAGLLVLTGPRQRPAMAAGVLSVLLVAHLLVGTAPAVALGVSAVCTVEALVVHRVLTLGGRRVALLEDGDVSRLVAAGSAGAALAAAGYAALVAVVGGDPAYAALVVLGTHAASLLVLLPLFLPTPTFDPVAGTTERVVRAVLLLGATVLVFAFTEAPPVLFAIMPIFAWLAFRGTLRESTLLLAAVAVVATGFTVAETGPVWALEPRYGLAPEVSLAVLQLFVVDCALVLLPVAVSVAQQRVASAHAVAGRTTLERLVAAATGTAIFATDTEGRVVLFNPGAEATFGYNLYEVLGQTPDRFFPADELARQAGRVGTGSTFAEICAGVVDSDEHRRLWRFRRQGGEERTLLMTLTRVLDEQGQPSGYLATGEDVTEREHAQAALVAAVETQR
jgi:PAS domain S-box-containing protein